MGSKKIECQLVKTPYPFFPENFMKKEYDFSKAKRGAILAIKGKTRITLYLDDDILHYFRQEAENKGKGYQTLINDFLRKAKSDKKIDSVITLRKIIREELKRVINE